MLSHIETYTRAVMPTLIAEDTDRHPTHKTLALSIAAYKLIDLTLHGGQTVTGWLRGARRRRQTLKALSVLDDRALKDIGVERAYLSASLEDGLRVSSTRTASSPHHYALAA